MDRIKKLAEVYISYSKSSVTLTEDMVSGLLDILDYTSQSNMGTPKGLNYGSSNTNELSKGYKSTNSGVTLSKCITGKTC